MKAVISSVVLGLFAIAASAADLFVDQKPSPFVQYAHLDPSSTIGGYPIYQGDGDWRVVEVVPSQTTAISGEAQAIKMGIAGFLQPTLQGGNLASMWVVANLTTTGVNQYMAGSPCGGTHLVTVNHVSGRDDNCMTIDVGTPSAADLRVSHFWIRITQNRSAGRSYHMDLRLNAGELGFANTVSADWSTDALGAAPSRKAFTENLKQWAVLLQNGANRALEFGKPMDAFSQVPPLYSLLPTSQAIANQ